MEGNEDDVEVKFGDDVCCNVLGSLVCVGLFIIIPASIIALILNTPSIMEPDLASHINSFSISIDNNSSTAICGVGLSLRKWKPSFANLDLATAVASVYYKEDRILAQVIPPFGLLPEREQVDFRFNLTAWLPGWAAEEFRYGRVFAFDFQLEGLGFSDGVFQTKCSRTLVRMWCSHLKAEHALHSDSATIQLVHGPLKCDASIGRL